MKALGKGSIASIVQIGLSFAWVVLWALFIAWALAAASYLVFILLTTIGVVDPATIPAIESSEQVRIQVEGIDPGALRALQWTDWQIFAPALLVGGVTIGGSLVIVSRLRRLFDSFTTGEPFRRENATHLRVIWITMVAIELSRYVLLATLGVLLGIFGAPDSVGSASYSINAENFSTWMSILILIVLAEVFREGARLKEEQELTI
ncbi:MAG: DUF2975 domain-containing protein [Hyphomonadaceae bacterium]